ncbi:probable leucine-rich repeat receptor-like protein kinase At1g35710 [Telopea speciosissima]|uniref:probable leucine-rich repeat receptor-like protein kinase At1g35710 n=1 Tax=Telopea speciosissima TaxID=54955 RepID=UPI001CC6469A|nr:probable leucine-rich repeat receptor-like protein kinase At1g35710 [Telopea speciosissima]
MLNLKWVFKFAFFFQFSVLFPETLTQTVAQTPVCSETDTAVLLGFKGKILKDTTEILSSWIGKDCCGGDWEGIQCNPTGRVIGLELQRPADRESGMYMKGTLYPSLGNLQFLETLVISGMKQIGGPIPESFSKLTHLTQLVLEDNSFEGSIPPSLGQLPLLKTLSLSGNHLKGQIRPSLGNLRNLIQMNFGKNFLTGPIPPTFKNLNSLLYLDLSYNLLSGLIPDFFGQFHNLTSIDLSNNKLSGQIPSSLCNLPNLMDLSLSHNQLTGRIPDQFGNIKSLTTLTLSDNQLTGQIPVSVSRLQKLWQLNLSRNGFSDPSPRILPNGIPSLLSIDLSYNKLHLANVPDWIRNKPLTDVHLAGCNLKGLLPNFPMPESLASVDLSDNFFTGGISNFFTNMSNLRKIKLSNNQLKSDVSLFFAFIPLKN